MKKFINGFNKKFTSLKYAKNMLNRLELDNQEKHQEARELKIQTQTKK